MAPTVLILADWYLPGSKAGGPISNIANLIELVGDEFRFHVITRDRDLNDKSAYAGVQTESWIAVGKARVLYTSNLSFANLRRHILEVAPSMIYLNSFFSPMTRKTLLLRRLGMLRGIAVVLAPQGEFSPGALGLKPLRKWVYHRLAMRTGLCRDLTWQATSELERQHIETLGIANGGRDFGRLMLTPNAPDANLLEFPRELPQRRKRSGIMRLIFLSRISRMKNLHFALEALASVRGHVQLEIVGPIEDREYWAKCVEKIRDLPENIVVRNTGPVQRESVRGVFLQHQFLLLPTLGENFGYAILEALAAGCPVIISDQTPWRGLRSAGIGWDLPLGRLEPWRNALNECVAMDDETYQLMSQRAHRFVETWCTSSGLCQDSASLFRSAVNTTAKLAASAPRF